MSRLDRLVILLETGSTLFIRNTAADQLLELARGHPEEILGLIARVYPFLQLFKWDTRVAAARAFGGIVQYSSVWDPNSISLDPAWALTLSTDDAANGNSSSTTIIKKEEKEEEQKEQPRPELSETSTLRQLDQIKSDPQPIIKQEIEAPIKSEDEESPIKTEDAAVKAEDPNGDICMESLVEFSAFDLLELLQSGKLFLANRLDDQTPEQSTGLLSKLKRHKVEHNDKVETTTPSALLTSLAVSDAVTIAPPTMGDSTLLPKPVSSARLKAMQRRRAKFGARTGSKTPVADLTPGGIARQLGDSPAAAASPNPLATPLDLSLAVASLVPLDNPSPEDAWIFQGVYELLISDLFDDRWEIRHGACLGLRELVRSHGNAIGRTAHRCREDNDKVNSRSLEDLAVRLCTLLALDRFGDYVSDTVVAPVRESGSQTLAALLLHLRGNDVVALRMFNCLAELVFQKSLASSISRCWEAMHGGMLGVRYFVSVRTDVLEKHPDVMDLVVAMVLHGLDASNDDDVQLVAALTLAPIALQFVQALPAKIPTLLTVIWDSLVNLKDDLSASIGLVMDLLSKLCAHDEVIAIMQKNAALDSASSFETLVPRLYPFLRHSITNVRKAVLRTVLAFLRIPDLATKKWVSATALRLIFQNLLVEQNREVQELSSQVFDALLAESASCLDELLAPQWQAMLSLVMTPIGLPRHNYALDTALIIRPSGHCAESNPRGHKRKSETNGDSVPDFVLALIEDDLKVNIDAPMYQSDVVLVGYETLLFARVTSARALGRALSYVTVTESSASMLEAVASHLKSPHATPRLLVAQLVDEWCVKARDLENETAMSLLKAPLTAMVTDPEKNLPAFRELVPTLKQVRMLCHQLFDVFVSQGNIPSSKLPQLAVIVRGESSAGPGAFGIDAAEKVLNKTFPQLRTLLDASHRILCNQALEDAKHRVSLAKDEASLHSNQRRIAVLAASLACLISLAGIPAKLNPVIRSLMDSVKEEEALVLQQGLASSVADLLVRLIDANRAGAADKIIKNLCAFACVDTLEVPEFHHNAQLRDEILTLRKEELKIDANHQANHEKELKGARIKRRGAMMTLQRFLTIYGADLFAKAPKLYDIMVSPLSLLSSESEFDDERGQQIIDAMGLVGALLPHLHPDLRFKVVDSHLESLGHGLALSYLVLRYATSKCFAAVCAVLPIPAFSFLVLHVLPILKHGKGFRERQGVVECIFHISQTMGSDILPYIVFLIVPVLGRMSDPDHDVRVLATSTFAGIIRLVPLEAGIADPEGMPPHLLEGRDRERQFIEQMMDPTKIAPFDVPVAIKATLRKYQQEGVNWLAFLNKYHLHGILCDDMGLGKTLQTICIIASDHYVRAENFKKTELPEYRPLPTLIVCPPSLTGHWEQELNQYAPFLKVLVYAGGPAIRRPLRNQIKPTICDVVVTSYDVARNDVDILAEHEYNYCILDEGHIIKNAQSKSTRAVKRFHAEHRLILTGTPVQNNVLELWSLFDFLMPGFLGTEKSFQERFAKPIAASRNSKTLTKEEELGALALELLHKQVLPFMLRRLKEEVLSDLPPKIIQDYYCEMSALQEQLYKECVRQQHPSVSEELTTGDEQDASRMHVFQALQYMRKLCNHPALVLTPSHPQMPAVNELLLRTKSTLLSIEHSPKLLSLRTLLWECGIGLEDSSEHKPASGEAVISQHRALVFCQLKDMLDIVELELLKKFLPLVTYMRLDGSTDPRDRQSIVRKFNADPSIDLLLLTTKVGGLGLNLTGADTVIFVEHDWNPMNDLQAMDRAHRLGQKKVVNVYRLITKNTLEEKIMGLQKFKMNIALTIVNQQNAGLQSMDTGQLLDLFDVTDKPSARDDTEEMESAKTREGVPTDIDAGGLTGKAAGAVGGLAELWDELQYENEYNLDNFIRSLK